MSKKHNNTPNNDEGLGRFTAKFVDPTGFSFAPRSGQLPRPPRPEGLPSLADHPAFKDVPAGAVAYGEEVLGRLSMHLAYILAGEWGTVLADVASMSRSELVKYCISVMALFADMLPPEIQEGGGDMQKALEQLRRGLQEGQQQEGQQEGA